MRTCTHMHAHMYTGTRTHKGMHPWMSMQKTHVHIGKHSCYYIALDECNPKFIHTLTASDTLLLHPVHLHALSLYSTAPLLLHTCLVLCCVCVSTFSLASLLAFLPNIFYCVLPSVWSLHIERQECHAHGCTRWAAGGDQVPVS